MTRIDPIEMLILNLEGELPEGALGFMNREDALSELKRLSSKDFGYDYSSWRSWKDEFWSEHLKNGTPDVDTMMRLFRKKKDRRQNTEPGNAILEKDANSDLPPCE